MKLTGGAAWSANERRARDTAAVAARWGEQGAGPAYQSEVGSALRGLESEREVGEGADVRAPCDREREGGGTGVGERAGPRRLFGPACWVVWQKEGKWSGLGRLG